FVGCALLLTGLPPLSGFIAKLAMLAALLSPAAADATAGVPVANWGFTALLVLSGLSALLALSRVGIRAFWAPVEAAVPRILVVEIAPVVFLLVLTLAL